MRVLAVMNILHAPRIVAMGVLVGLVLGVPTATANPPADAFCVILIEPNADFTRLTISVDENTTLEDRAALWPSVDLDENKVISPTEKEAFRWANTNVFGRDGDVGIKAVTLLPGAPYLTSQPQKPVYTTIWRQIGHVFHHQDYVLPERLTSTAELETQEVREFGFELEPGRASRYTLSGGENLTGNLSATPTYIDQPRPVVEYVVIRAPEGWIVDRIEGRSYNGTFVLTPGTPSVDVPAFDTKSPYAIMFVNPVFDQDLGKIAGGSGLDAVAFIATLAAAVILVRRRR